MSQQIDTYISKQPSPQKEILMKIRELIRETIPQAEERMSYGAPSFRLNGKSILYAAFKKHVGIYPEPEIIEKFKIELHEYKTSKGTIKFNIDKPIPYTLIKQIVMYKYQA